MYGTIYNLSGATEDIFNIKAAHNHVYHKNKWIWKWLRITWEIKGE